MFLLVTILNWRRYGFKEPRFHFPLIFSTRRTIYPPRLPRKFIQPINAAFDFLCVQGKYYEILERDLGPTLLSWRQNFLCIELSFLRNLRSTKFHSIITSSYEVMVDHIICLLTCKPTDVTNFAVFTIVSPNFYDR